MHMEHDAAPRRPCGFFRAPAAMLLTNPAITAGMLAAAPALLAGESAYAVAASVAGYLALCLTAVLLSPKGARLRWLGAGRASPVDIAGGALAMLCLVPFLVLVAAVSAAIVPSSTLEIGEATAAAMTEMGPAFRLLAFALAPALGEEVLCRGMLYAAARPYGRACAVVLPSVCFAVLHGNLQQCLYAFAAGILLSFLRDASGSLWPCVAAHFAFNAVSALPDGLPAIPAAAIAAGAAVLPWASAGIVRRMYLLRGRTEAPAEKGAAAFAALTLAATAAAMAIGCIF